MIGAQLAVSIARDRLQRTLSDPRQADAKVLLSAIESLIDAKVLALRRELELAQQLPQKK